MEQKKRKTQIKTTEFKKQKQFCFKKKVKQTNLKTQQKKR